MSFLDEKTTDKLAHLARLELTPQERKEYTLQIGSVLDYMIDLESVDVSGVEPMVQPFFQKPLLREDQVNPTQYDILKCSENVLYEGFRVPAILS